MLFLSGGKTATDSFSSSAFLYDGRDWISTEAMDVGRNGHACGAVEGANAVWVAGGYKEGNLTHFILQVN
jgi:hypothetical protein